ncbi:MAG: S9 family peptidase [Calditrichae bacterium]|nr:S9 family peptidase [Calditrichia bacterium]
MKYDQQSFYRKALWAAGMALWLCLPLLAQNDGMTAEQVVSLKSVRQAAIDPAGQHIAYVLSVPREAEEAPGRSYAELWVRPLAGGDAVQYSSRPYSATSVSWSPDGKFLYFLSKRTEHYPQTQVYRIPVNGGAAEAVTSHSQAVSQYSLSPDGRWVAFISKDPLSKEEAADEEAGKDWIIPDSNFKYSRLYLHDNQSGESHQLVKENLSVHDIYWSPDSRSLVIRATETPLTDDDYMYSKFYTVSADQGSVKPLCQTEGKLGDLAFSPDGKQIAFLGAVDISDPLAQSLFVVPAEGGAPKNLSGDFEGSGVSLDWLDAKTILLLSSEGTVRTLRSVDAASGKMKLLVKGAPNLQSFSLHPQKKIFAAVADAPAHPNEVYSGTLKDGKLQRLTDHNPQLAEVQLARQEVIEWQGADGWRIEGVLTYPLNYREGQRYPLALQIHGGPEGVSLNGWTTRPTYPVQVLAANGYLVLEPNYRGSGGRGVAFSKADHDDLGGKEFEDVLAGVDALVERGLADNEQVCTGGWSYGGYFSAWAATRHSQRFKAAMVAAGLTNWMSFTGTTDIPHEMSLVHWNSYWYQQRDLHWERSPLYHIQNAQTPTLVVHGLKDERVHPGQSHELYTALKHNNVDTKLILYPREPHGLTERAHEIHFINNLIQWFNVYVKKKKGPEVREKMLN